MPAARDTRHVPVLLDAVLATLAPQPGMIVVDCTVGLGGHSAALLRRVQPDGRLIGIDFDPANLDIARSALSATGGRFDLFHNNFAALPAVLAEAGAGHIDVLLADLGVSSPHLDDPARGFSFKRAGPLDMRMDPTRGQPASTLVNRLSERELADSFLELGDEEDAEAIARRIVERRAVRPVMTTDDLCEIICEARDFTLVRAAGAKLHPATRTFQALRILVNREMANLDRLLKVLPDCLAPGGIAGIISFHSGEDRRVKAAFKTGFSEGHYSAVARDPVVATDAELKANGRARSAKLRWARRA